MKAAIVTFEGVKEVEVISAKKYGAYDLFSHVPYGYVDEGEGPAINISELSTGAAASQVWDTEEQAWAQFETRQEQIKMAVIAMQKKLKDRNTEAVKGYYYEEVKP